MLPWILVRTKPNFSVNVVLSCHTSALVYTTPPCINSPNTQQLPGIRYAKKGLAKRFFKWWPMCITTILFKEVIGGNITNQMSNQSNISDIYMYFKMSSGKWWPFCLGFNVLITMWPHPHPHPTPEKWRFGPKYFFLYYHFFLPREHLGPGIGIWAKIP